MLTKECSNKHHIGNRELPIENFHNDKSTSDGLSRRCKVCARKHARIWRAEKAKDPSWRKKFNESNKKSRNKGGKQSQLYYAAKERARKKGIEFTITKDDITIPEFCPILGIRIISGFGENNTSSSLVGAKDSSPSLDRIDNHKGYTPENVIVISWRANYLKNTATLNELVLLGKFANKQLNNDKL